MRIEKELEAQTDFHKNSYEERSAQALETLLDNLANGALGNFSSFYSTISNSLLYAPVTRLKEQEGSDRQSKVNVLNFNDKGRRVVPVFTRKCLFDEWIQDGNQQIFSIVGGDLALTLPKGSWILLNPGTATSVEISPEQVEVLANTEPEDIHGLMSPQPQPEEAEDDKSFILDAELNGSDLREDLETPEEKQVEFDPAFIQVRSQLESILCDFEEVQEAYIRVPDDGPAYAILGLLNTPIGAERRFILIEKIAELARESFGAAGAIEVYDDLSFNGSTSWSLFNAITPFYTLEGALEYKVGVS